MDTQELIGKIESGDMADAGKAFSELMNAKVQAALDDRKVELGNQMHLSPEEKEELEAQAELDDEDFEDDDLEDEDEDEESEDETEEDDEEDEDEDVQSDETEPQ